MLETTLTNLFFLFWAKKLSNESIATRGTELAKQMQAHGISDPEDLTEFDIEWVNPATPKDIEATQQRITGRSSDSNSGSRGQKLVEKTF